MTDPRLFLQELEILVNQQVQYVLGNFSISLAMPALSSIGQHHKEAISRSSLLAAWVSRIRQRLETLPHLASSPADRPRDLFEPSWPLAAAI